MSRSVSSFEKLRKLGEGTYGTVYQAKDKTSGQLVALKRLKIGAEGFEREGMPVTSLREVTALHPVAHSLLRSVQKIEIDTLCTVFWNMAMEYRGSYLHYLNTAQAGDPLARGKVLQDCVDFMIQHITTNACS
eukprot:2038303-Pleurochrysis_carterae.AAC.3